MNSRTRLLALLIAVSTLSGCGSSAPTRPAYDFWPLVESDPRSVVVAPVAGYRDAPQEFLSTIAQPLAERGYYVMPVRMTDTILRQAGFAPFKRKVEPWLDFNTKHNGRRIVEPEQYAEQIGQQAVELASFVGADAVLFVHILSWEHELDLSEGLFSNVISERTNHAVGLDFQLVDKRGVTVWRAERHFEYTRGGGSIFKEVWDVTQGRPSDDRLDALIARDINRVMIEGRRSKLKVVSYFSGPSLVVGPYHPLYESDRARRTPPPSAP
ncbi:MAG: DUF799 domain-containing protein [Gammaproteobacteria bacterium]|nr:DUF799 domain-containing protein [Gammaproteobacteria bacterium]MDH4256371.1 DUF799 domain-containing protein [Gammaproteobacteria bacterium]